MIGSISIAVASAVFFSSCARPTVDLQREGEALKQLSREWSAQIPTRNIEKIVAYWAEDAVMMPPGQPPVVGKAAIRQYVEGAMRVPGFNISWEPLSVHVSRGGDMAYLIERNVATVNDPSGKPVTTHGKVVTVWRKDANGQWKNVVDMWNEAPAPK